LSHWYTEYLFRLRSGTETTGYEVSFVTSFAILDVTVLNQSLPSSLSTDLEAIEVVHGNSVCLASIPHSVDVRVCVRTDRFTADSGYGDNLQIDVGLDGLPRFHLLTELWLHNP
jgi:hypothetical protein